VVESGEHHDRRRTRALALGRAKRLKNGQWEAACPAHDDTHASLHITKGNKLPIVFACRSGCANLDIIAELKSRRLWGKVTATAGEPEVAFTLPSSRRLLCAAGGRISPKATSTLGVTIRPYHPNLIPAVFVHGTASSPVRWAEMANELLGDPMIASHYQLWLFIYNTGNQIVLSAMRFRESLQAVRKGVDPQGKDAALDRMVLIGHSQGRLLTKIMVVDGGNRFWSNVTSVPFDQAELDPDTRDLASHAMFFKP